MTGPAPIRVPNLFGAAPHLRDTPVRRDVVFVCTGNICRSPLAEKLLAHRRPELRVASAGLAAVVGAPMDSFPARYAQGLGAGTTHRARQWEAADGWSSTLVLTMSTRQRSDILAQTPGLLHRTFTLLEFVAVTAAAGRLDLADLTAYAALHRSSGAKTPDVADPFKAPADVHERTATLIAGAVDALASRVR